MAQRSGDWVEAAQNIERAIEIQPTPMAYRLLAQVLESAGKKDAADAARAQAERMTSDLTRGAPKEP